MNIIFFDGECNLCNGAVNFIIDRDPEGYFKFAPLQSEKAIEHLGESKAKQKDSIVLYKDGFMYEKSTAAIKIARSLTGAWPMVYVFIIVPAFLRDFFYDVIAKRRYEWFGKRDSCRIATPDIKGRFL